MSQPSTAELKHINTLEILLAETPKTNDLARGYAVILHDPHLAEFSWVYTVPKSGTATGYSHEIYADDDKCLDRLERLCKIGAIQIEQVSRFLGIIGETLPGPCRDFADRFLKSLVTSGIMEMYALEKLERTFGVSPDTGHHDHSTATIMHDTYDLFLGKFKDANNQWAIILEDRSSRTYHIYFCLPKQATAPSYVRRIHTISNAGFRKLSSYFTSDRYLGFIQTKELSRFKDIFKETQTGDSVEFVMRFLQNLVEAGFMDTTVEGYGELRVIEEPTQVFPGFWQVAAAMEDRWTGDWSEHVKEFFQRRRGSRSGGRVGA
ncbi:hypothetical protein BJX70DRAFT_403858 [Aspergillus crustosus]